MEWSELVEEKLQQLTIEYDISDLAANDLLQLQSLAEAMASLSLYTKLLEEELSLEEKNIRKLAEIQKIITEASKNISSISSDLKIDRKSREKKVESVPDYIKDLKTRGKKFLEQRMYYIYCPKCKTLLSSMWLLKTHVGSKFKFVCTQCNNVFIVEDTDIDLHKNIPEVIVPLGPD